METPIGARITALREAAGLTQKDLAEKLKTTQSAIARIETGKQNVSTDLLRKISTALKRNIVSAQPGSVNIAIEGGKALTGTIETNTSKNGAVGLLCASLLNEGTTILKRMPRIEEVHRLIEVLESIDVKVEWKGSDVYITAPKKFALKSINIEAARRTRSIVMFIGPLIHKLTSFNLPQSGGCKLGSRTVQPHFFALEHFGVDIKTTEDAFVVKRVPKKPSEITL